MVPLSFTSGSGVICLAELVWTLLSTAICSPHESGLSLGAVHSMGLGIVTLSHLPLQHHIQASVHRFCNPPFQVNKHARPRRTPAPVARLLKHQQHRCGEQRCVYSKAHWMSKAHIPQTIPVALSLEWEWAALEKLKTTIKWGDCMLSTGNKVPRLLIFSREGNDYLSQKSVNIKC